MKEAWKAHPQSLAPYPRKGLFKEAWKAQNPRKGLFKEASEAPYPRKGLFEEAWKAPYPRKGLLKEPWKAQNPRRVSFKRGRPLGGCRLNVGERSKGGIGGGWGRDSMSCAQVDGNTVQ